MEYLKPKKIVLSEINNGLKYENGNGVQPNAINSPIEAAAYAQALATNQPIYEENGGEPAISIDETSGTPTLRFENIKGKDGEITNIDAELSDISKNPVQNKVITEVLFGGTEGLEYRLSSDGTYYSCYGMGTATENQIEIASIYNGKPVKSISDWSGFIGNREIATIKLKNGIQTLGEQSFMTCKNLIKVEIPNSIKTINSWVFGYTRIKELVVPNGVTTMKNHVCFECSQLETAIIGNGVPAIQSHAFYNCKKLTYVYIGSGVASIENNALNTYTGGIETLYIRASAPPTLASAGSITLKNGATIYIKMGTLTNPNEDKTVDAELYYDTATNWSSLVSSGKYTFTEVE